MKLSKNNAFSIAVVVGLTTNLGIIGLNSALAQTELTTNNEQPVNLLSRSMHGNGNESEDSGGNVRTIDDVFNEVANDIETGLVNNPTDRRSAPDVSAATLREGDSNDKSRQATGQTEQVLFTEDTSITIGSDHIKDVGLAAIGVSQTIDNTGKMNELIWRGTSANRARYIYENKSLTSQSRAISSLALDVIAQEAVPPAGANKMARALVQARLKLLASAGRSDDLAFIVGLLPNDDDWLDWKKWLVEYQLMQRLDKDACAVVESYIATTLDPYWHKLKVICRSVQDDVVSARFGADILAASGVEDPVFFALVDEMLSGNEALAFDPALVEALHVVLMDAAHHEISLDSLRALPPEMAQGAVALRYLGADARLVSTFDGLSKGLITPSEAGSLWRSVAIAPELAEVALARHNSASSPLTTAMTWRAIASDASAGRLLLVAQAMKTDIANGNGQIMLPLYAELASEALTFPGLDSAISADDGQSLAAVAMLIAIQKPEIVIPDNMVGASTKEVAAARALMQMLATGEWNHRALDDLDLWTLLPLIESLGIVPSDHEWFDFLSSSTDQNKRYQPLSPLLLRVLKNAAEKRHFAETVLLASWALGDTPLQHINPQDIAVIVRAMNEIGQTKTGRLFATEVVKTHLLSRLSQMAPLMSGLSPTAQQDQALVVEGDSLSTLYGTFMDETGQDKILATQGGSNGSTGAANENSGVETATDNAINQ